MTDLEAMKDMLNRAKIAFEETATEPQFAAKKTGDVPSYIQLRVEDGYPCFYSLITFNPDGSLRSIAAYE